MMANTPSPGGLTSMFDAMYDRPDYRYGKRPNAFLAEVLPGLVAKGARVLCVGDGEGRNGVWCATQGFEVTSMEPSGIGVDKIRALARERGVKLEVIRDRMPSARVAEASFDAVALIYVHAPGKARRALHGACAAALRPGGVVVLEAFTPAQRANDRSSGGPPDAALMFKAADLRADFTELEIERLEEVEVKLDEGEGHCGLADVVRLIARKPA
jgi:SAM-dependent methyltransferase